MSERLRTPVEPVTTHYVTNPVPPDAYIHGLFGATALVKMRRKRAPLHCNSFPKKRR